MATQPEAQTAYDPGPLLWVRGEIEHSLGETRTNLDTIGAKPGDSAAMQAVTTDLHQVAGALRMVDLGAAARLTDEIEKLSLTFKDSPSDLAQRVVVAKHAITKLSNYLDTLVAGKPNRPMALAEPYAMVNKARGANDATAADLFSPDLTVEAPGGGSDAPQPTDDLSEAINQQRGIFQTGLLQLLRDKNLADGARNMGEAVSGIEALLANSPSRAFWFTAGGFFDAVANDPAGTGAHAVRLFGKVDQQIKMLIAGTDEVPEKLFRELLLVIGRSKAHTDRIEQIRELYKLDELLSAPEQQPAHKKLDKELAAVVRALKEQVQMLKDHLLLFISGDTQALDPLAKQGEALASLGQKQPNAEMGRLLKQTGKAPNEAQSMEIATTLLFIEASLDEYFDLDQEFDKQAAMIFSRVRGIMSGASLPSFERSVNNLADTMTLRAQTQLLVFQVGREVQANLANIERTLDDYFRDPTKAAALATLDTLFKQVRGAFSMLEEEEAAALTRALSERVVKYASGELKGEGEEAVNMAEGVSALGLYVEALQRSSTDPRSILMPTLLRFGMAKKEPEKKPPKEVKPAATKEPAKAAAAPATAKAPEPAPSSPLALEEAGNEKATSDEEVAADKTAVAEETTAAEVAPAGAGEAASELERLRESEAKLKAQIEERDKRIRTLQGQLVALHAEAKKVTKLEADLRSAREALAKVVRKTK
jgi:chemosensory pili system protein ChpA (sensor histidine kinase/response regulator)